MFCYFLHPLPAEIRKIKLCMYCGRNTSHIYDGYVTPQITACQHLFLKYLLFLSYSEKECYIDRKSILYL